MIDIREIYRNNEGVKKDNKYSSPSYSMQIFNETYINLEKAFYNPDIIQKREELRKWAKKKEGVWENANRHREPTPEEWGKYFDHFSDYIEAGRNESLFFGVDVWTSIKRETELQIYLDDKLKEADKKAETDIYEAICYLIDQKHTLHKDILDEGIADLLLRDEINAIIFDCLQLKINKISDQQPPEPQPFAPIIPKKPFKWNSNKQTLGTLFGVLFNRGIIEGNASDFQTQILALFENAPAKTTLADNINLKVSDGRAKYCENTEVLLKDWITFLKEKTTKTKK
ncbi:hypothetical protein [Riemerella columbina]|uniref:hypothetical protein n=1 Tax=Riemerella columbina TaxID=103810 RepID=UPI00266F9759|nr:hypothetical protein [Riemerella columbina]WKS95892.1 hypothetical protein NYR17_03940 [Riemerella columbina]